ncbi:hypothetical protein EXU85_19240 [Spirosoma sp. KCTC 42546]|uniref:hypothetical protein n=1 Tax=Spirosoma sp. KCTC 42546 TaxID=2520506 RepID=UPI00115794D6|nr:hypothetical protein [Spirosoma sp. KCTC 42546]QDK80626.1 hypothetical protein EXU85_19240 [Spirosoma sp. KCTC 42546]
MMKQIVFAFVLIGLNSGCGGSRCELDAENYRARECAIKVEARDFTGKWFSITGRNVNKGGQVKYADLGSWYPLFEDHIDIGDTVVKRKNELVFYIHKKDTVLTFPFECEGQVIK